MLLLVYILMSYLDLYNRSISALTILIGLENINHDILEYVCRYYYAGLDKKTMYNELKNKFIDKDVIAAILNLVACLKDRNKQCFPSCSVYCNAMRNIIYG